METSSSRSTNVGSAGDNGKEPVQAPVGAEDAGNPAKSRLFLRLFLQNERRLYAYILTLLPTARMPTMCCRKRAW